MYASPTPAQTPAHEADQPAYSPDHVDELLATLDLDIVDQHRLLAAPVRPTAGCSLRRPTERRSPFPVRAPRREHRLPPDHQCDARSLRTF